jgi:molybdopterin/thiamine biosynthesis adenylyltransferase
VVREVEFVPEAAYTRRTATAAELSPDFVAQVAQRARRKNESVVFVHTHPFELNQFSDIDDGGEKCLAEFLERRIPGVLHAALLLTPSMSIARVLGTQESLQVAQIGATVTIGTLQNAAVDARFDRQVRAFGRDGQNRISATRVAIIGLGGTGSVVAQQLAHLGVQRFLLIDPDHLEETNLNRVVGSQKSDVGRPKVEIAADLIRSVNPMASVATRTKTILGTQTARELSAVDFLFCCTDSHGSRSVLNQISYQYLIPGVDVGVVIAAPKGQVTHVAGRTRMLCPGIACLVCENILDAEEVRREFLSDEERKRDPYIVDGGEPQPAVISLNSTVSALGVTMFLNAVAGIPGTARFLNYNALTGTTRSVMITPHPKCVVCSPQGALARGQAWALPTRNDW